MNFVTRQIFDTIRFRQGPVHRVLEINQESHDEVMRVYRTQSELNAQTWLKNHFGIERTNANILLRYFIGKSLAPNIIVEPFSGQ